MREPAPSMDAVLKMAQEAPVEHLPRLVGVLHHAAALAHLRLVTTTPAESSSTSKWLTPEEAAEKAHVSVRRIYRWAADKPWAKRPTSRCLLINESGFAQWLDAA